MRDNNILLDISAVFHPVDLPFPLWVFMKMLSLFSYPPDWLFILFCWLHITLPKCIFSKPLSSSLTWWLSQLPWVCHDDFCAYNSQIYQGTTALWTIRWCVSYLLSKQKSFSPTDPPVCWLHYLCGGYCHPSIHTCSQPQHHELWILPQPPSLRDPFKLPSLPL